MPGVTAGLVPDRIWKQLQCGVPDLNSDECRWSEGDTITFGIGQSYLLTTPLNQAVYVATLANGGHPLRPPPVHEGPAASGGGVPAQKTEGTPPPPSSAGHNPPGRGGHRPES